MTKYILHGGETGIPNEHNAAFYQEWIKGFPADFKPSILLVYFSRPEEEWQGLENSDKERFSRYNQDREANFSVASQDLFRFLEQIKSSDVVYVRGGSTEKLLETILPIKDRLLSAWDNKVYAGSSAGVMAISHLTRSNIGPWRHGLGLIPLNSFVHYGSEFRLDLEACQNDHPENSLEYLLLPETEFVVREY
ncbi:MAG: Type 1 glutamine amidotransferase-like domain-containing protein [Patescibacteria group bacterium]